MPKESSLYRASIFVISVSIAACSTHRMPVVLPDEKIGETSKIMVVTDRKQNKEEPQNYTGERDSTLHYNEVDVWIPKDRKQGKIKMPSKKPKIKRQYAITKSQSYDHQEAFIARINSLMEAKTDKTVFLFVHGYNMSYAYSLYFQAQLQHDFGQEALGMQFSWPSAGRLDQYMYDRESAQFARQDFIKTLRMIEKSDAENLVILAHSMGAYLVNDSLQFLSLQGDQALLSKIDALAYASPDIDMDVFERQWAQIDPQPNPFVVFINSKDRALRSSAFMRKNQPRLGTAAPKLNADDNVDIDMIIVDLSNENAVDQTFHFTFARAPKLMGAWRYDQLHELEKNLKQVEEPIPSGAASP